MEKQIVFIDTETIEQEELEKDLVEVEDYATENAGI